MSIDWCSVYNGLGGANWSFWTNKLKSSFLENLESMTYSEETLTSRNSSNEKELKISDIATKEFLETLKLSEALPYDWEVVYPDCPIDAKNDSNGVFSVPA